MNFREKGIADPGKNESSRRRLHDGDEGDLLGGFVMCN